MDEKKLLEMLVRIAAMEQRHYDDRCDLEYRQHIEYQREITHLEAEIEREIEERLSGSFETEKEKVA